jgi:hypothetical protein
LEFIQQIFLFSSGFLEAQCRKDNQVIMDSGVSENVEVLPHHEINTLEVI